MDRFVIACFMCLTLGFGAFDCGVGTSPTAAAQGNASPKELILGKWIGTEAKQEMPLDFRNDGTFTVTIKNKNAKKPVTSTRTYRWIKDDQIESTVAGLKNKFVLFDIKVTADELTYKVKLLGEVYGEGKYKRAR